MSAAAAQPVVGFIGLGDQGLPMVTAIAEAVAGKDDVDVPIVHKCHEAETVGVIKGRIVVVEGRYLGACG